MTYACINPRSPKLPRGNYCKIVIGVVRETTADTEGLADIASLDLSLWFDETLDLEMSKASGRIARTRAYLQDLITQVIDDSHKALD